jgi:hypothetical protein
MKDRSGRRWAYATMLAMLTLSIAGNVAHTQHIDADPGVRALTYAVMWPLMVWAGVELFVRVPWRNLLTHRLVRWVGILLVSSIAALVSYRHLRGLLLADGEEWTVYTFGPLAVDGLMLMSTLALLLTRPQGVHAAVGSEVLDVDAILERHGVTAQELPVPVSAPPAPAAQSALPEYATAERGWTTAEERAEERVTRTRAGSGELEQKVRELLADPELKAGAAESSTVRRYAKVARTLRDSPTADIDSKAEKVRPELVAIIRDQMMRERVR